MTTQMLKDAGFHDVIAEDRTEQVISLSENPLVIEQFLSLYITLVKYFRNQLCHQYFTHFHILFFQFLNVLRRELGEVEKNKEAFLADFTQVMHRSYRFMTSLTCIYASFGRV